MPRVDGALATAPKPLRRPLPTVTSEPTHTNLSGAVQRPLPFSDQRRSNVIAFESFLPAPPKKARPAASATGEHGTRTASRPRAPRVSPDQGSLDFIPAAQAKPRTLGTSVEAVIYCDAPVATPLHRAVAGALDLSTVLIGYGLFLLTFYLFGGEFFLSRLTLPIFAGALVVVGFTYGIFYALAGGETAGMQWTRLRLITFDGSQPERKQLVIRFVSSCLSLCTVLGLLWSLVDEESLGWQDHMSSTFPTPATLETRTFRRQ